MDMGKQKMMEGKKAFQRELLQIAVPVTLQCLMQSSFSVVDQIMTGQLGSISIAGIGLGGKFASIYSVVAAAFGKYYVLIFRAEDDRVCAYSICPGCTCKSAEYDFRRDFKERGKDNLCNDH